MKHCRWIAFLLVIALCAVCAPGMAEESKPMTMIGLDSDGTERDWAQCRFFDRMAAATGVSFSLQQYRDSKVYQAAIDDAFHGHGTVPGVLFKANLSPQQEMEYLKNGFLVDLAPYLAEHAPNLFTILEARPDWRAVIEQPGGAITSLPALNGAERQCCVWINQKWLDALGLQMPSNIDEYTDVLRAMRDGDPNGNGKKDEIPLSLVGPFEAKYLLHAWGLTPNDYNIYVDEQGAVRFAPFEEEYRVFVEWLKMALSESLIDPDTFRQMQSTRSTALSTTDTDAPLTIGGMVSTAPYTLINMDKTTEYSALRPLEYQGKRVYRRLLGGVARGTFAITSACEDIPAALRWVDYLYTEAGGRLAFAGQEGEDYEIAANGSWKWTSGEDYTVLTDIVANSVIAGDGRTPGLEPAAFMRNSEITADNHVRRQADTLRDYLVEPFPVTWPTDAAREARIAELQEALGACVDTAIANFAMGIVPLDDEHWNAFMEDAKALGAEEFVALWQAKYDEVKE